jgi:TctA family transporter
MIEMFIYFGIGIILSIILAVLYVLTTERKYESGIIEILGIEDTGDLGLCIFLTLCLWPLELMIPILTGLFYLTWFLWTNISEGLVWLIKKIIKIN